MSLRAFYDRSVILSERKSHFKQAVRVTPADAGVSKFAIVEEIPALRPE